MNKRFPAAAVRIQDGTLVVTEMNPNARADWKCYNVSIMKNDAGEYVVRGGAVEYKYYFNGIVTSPDLLKKISPLSIKTGTRKKYILFGKKIEYKYAEGYVELIGLESKTYTANNIIVLERKIDSGKEI